MTQLSTTSNLASPSITASNPAIETEMRQRTPMRFPVEILESILSVASPSSIALSMQSSWVLHTIGQPILYRHISNDKYDLRRSRRLLRTLESNPNLALLVRTLALRLPPSFNNRKDRDSLDGALRNMANIEKLDLPLPVYGPDLLAGVIYPQLNSLKFMALPNSPNLPFNDDFLMRHPNIRTLHITGNNTSIVGQLPDSALRQLATLSVTYPLHLLSLAPNRPLNSVTVNMANLEEFYNLPRALTSLHHASGNGVQVLSLDLRGGSGGKLDGVLQALAGLPLINLTIRFIGDGPPTLDRLGEFFSTLACLRTLAITHNPNYLNNRRADQSILDWFILCPALEVASILEKNITHRKFSKRVPPPPAASQSNNEDDNTTTIDVTWRKYDHLRNLTDEPEGYLEWELIGYIWEPVKEIRRM